MKKLLLLFGIVLLPLFSVKCETTWIEKNITGLMDVSTDVLKLQSSDVTKSYFIYNITRKVYGFNEMYEMRGIDYETDEICDISVVKYSNNYVYVFVKYSDYGLRFKFYNFLYVY